MNDHVTMRVTLDPVLRERIKLLSVTRGMTLGELLPQLLERSMETPDTAIASAESDSAGAGEDQGFDDAECAEEPPAPEPLLQDIVRQQLDRHAEGVKKAFILIADKQDAIGKLFSEQSAQVDKAITEFGKRSDEAVEKSTRDWQHGMRARRLNRNWLGGTFAVGFVACLLALVPVAGTSLGRTIAVWQTGADTGWQAAQLLASKGSYLHSHLAAETSALLDNVDFRQAYSKCIERAKAARNAVNCKLVLPALARRP